MRHRRANRTPGVRPGFTLMELVLVMVVLGICLTIGTTLVVVTFQADRAGETASRTLSRRAELAQQFRDDVARAEAAPEKLDDLAAGPGLLILRMPGGATVQYKWENNGLVRIERAEKQESRRVLPVPSEKTALEFVRPAAGPGVVTLRITDSAGQGPARQTELSAALGGNLR